MFERPASPRGSETRSQDGWRVFRDILALKRLGFSIDEMSGMTVAEFIALTDLAWADPEPGKPREATQEDIDRLLG